MRSLRLLATTLTACLAVAPTTLGEGTLVEKIDVTVVEVDVVVTDRKGHPVRGLGAEDFEVRIDGTPAEITNFSVTELKGRADGVAGEPGDERSRLLLAIYVDQTNVDRQRRNEALRQIQEFLATDLEPGDRVLVASANRSNLQAHHALTDRMDLIATGLEEIRSIAARDQRSSEFREILRGIERFAGGGGSLNVASVGSRVETLEARIRAFHAESQRDSERVAVHLTRLVDALAGLSGKKAILYLGGPLSLRPGEALSNALSQALGRFGTSAGGAERSDGSLAAGSDADARTIDGLAEHAGAREVAIYAIAAESSSGSSIELTRGATAGDASAPGQEGAWAPGVGFSHRLELRSALELLAETTGGRTRVDSGDVRDLLENLFDDSRTYYSLGIRPVEDPASDRIHRLEVRAGRGREARHRRAFRARDPDHEAAQRTLSALLLEAPENPLEIRFEAGEARPIEKHLFSVPVSVQVPVAALAVAAKGPAHVGQVTIFLVAGNRGLATGPVHRAVFPVTLANAEIAGAMGRVFDYRLELPMPAGRSTLAVGVRDDLDPHLSIATLELVVGDAAAR